MTSFFFALTLLSDSFLLSLLVATCHLAFAYLLQQVVLSVDQGWRRIFDLYLERLTRYQHQALPDSDHIRLLELQPRDGALDQPLRCKIHVTTLKAPSHPFAALSYVWGDDKEENKVPIVINQQILKITPSLESALLRIQEVSVARFLWVDGICIDQSSRSRSLKERAAQVRKMDQIFAKAERVVVDLGEASAMETEILRTLDRYRDIPYPRWVEIEIQVKETGLNEASQALTQHGLPGTTDDFWPKFVRLMSRPWFQRVWIIQEFAVATSSMLMLGNETRDGSYLSIALARATFHIYWLYVLDRRHPQNEEPSERFANLIWDMNVPNRCLTTIEHCYFRDPDYSSFCYLLWRMQHSRATDPRDRVYAILGLVSDGDLKSSLPVDYREPANHLAVRVSGYLLAQGHGPYILYNCVGLNPNGIPSWAVVLGQKKENPLDESYDPRRHLYEPLYSAAGSTEFQYRLSDPSRFRYTRRPCAKPARVVLPAIVIDTVADIGPGFPYFADLAFKDVKSYSRVLADVQEWAQSALSAQKLPREAFTKAVWQTLIADQMIVPRKEGLGWQRASHQSMFDECISLLHLLGRWALAERRGEPNSGWPYPDNIRHLAGTVAEGIRFAAGRRLALTGHHGLLALVPEEAVVGEKLCIISGCEMPFVIRSTRVLFGRSKTGLVGSCYVHDMMDGQAVGDERWTWEEIEIR